MNGRVWYLSPVGRGVPWPPVSPVEFLSKGPHTTQGINLPTVNLLVCTDKIPTSKVPTLKKSSEGEVSPTTSVVSLEDEVIALRARNKAMATALRKIKETAEQERKRHHDLVWYARNRSRFPNHEARKRIEQDEQHQEELEKLSTAEADYFHGIHSGILAATRVFEKQADILHVNEKDNASEVMTEAAKHEKKIEESLENYPHVHAADSPDEH